MSTTLTLPPKDPNFIPPAAEPVKLTMPGRWEVQPGDHWLVKAAKTLPLRDSLRTSLSDQVAMRAFGALAGCHEMKFLKQESLLALAKGAAEANRIIEEREDARA